MKPLGSPHHREPSAHPQRTLSPLTVSPQVPARKSASLGDVGQHVTAGQPIAVMGHTGDAASLRHGHIEIGFSDATGNPLDHPGTVATASGTAIRSFLIELSRAFGIHNARSASHLAQRTLSLSPVATQAQA